jgi:hypothetical protein
MRLRKLNYERTSQAEKSGSIHPEEEYKALRIRLIEMGKTVSGWVREVVRELLRDDY